MSESLWTGYIFCDDIVLHWHFDSVPFPLVTWIKRSLRNLQNAWHQCHPSSLSLSYIRHDEGKITLSDSNIGERKSSKPDDSSAENFAEVVPGREEENWQRQTTRGGLGSCAKVNKRSTLISLEYIAVICPLCWIKSLLSYRFER